MSEEAGIPLRELFQTFAKQFREEASRKATEDLAIFQTLRVHGREVVEMVLRDKGVSNVSTRVDASIGIGIRTYYPWLAVLDTRVTTIVLKGYYVVYLFSDDASELYLTLNQGSTRQTKGEIEENQKKVFSVISALPGFQKGRLPFPGEHEAAIVYSIVNETPEPTNMLYV